MRASTLWFRDSHTFPDIVLWPSANFPLLKRCSFVRYLWSSLKFPSLLELTFSCLLQNLNSKGRKLMYHCSLIIPALSFPSKEYRPNILPNAGWFCVVMRLESSSIWRTPMGQVLEQNKDTKIRTGCLTIKTSQISLMIWKWIREIRTFKNYFVEKFVFLQKEFKEM